MTQHRVLFVCLGNICRSPMAEGVFRHVAAAGSLDVHVDSAGCGAWHAGNPPDARARKAARARGIDITGQKARQVVEEDFESFDLILAMDESNLSHLRAMAPAGSREKVRLFMEFAPRSGPREVPDPYYGDAGGFEAVLDMIEEASRGLLAHLGKLR
ncbi:MAG: low molecular weight protein-tyrosine-phosphatase [Hyphomicrobiales bacterium]